MSLVPASALHAPSTPEAPGSPTGPGANDEAASAASRAAAATGELVQALKQAGQNDEVVDELERTRAMLNRVHEVLCKGKGARPGRQAIKGSKYGMDDAATDLVRDIRNPDR